MSTGLILGLAVLAILVVSILWAMLRGLAKARIRAIIVLVCAVLAVVVTVVVKQTVVASPELEELLIEQLENAVQSEDGAKFPILEIMEVAPTLYQVALNSAAALIAPVLCLLLFLIFSILSWFGYFIVTLIIRRRLKEQNSRASLKVVRSSVWGLVQGLVSVVILLLPISVYLQVAMPAADAAIENNLLENDTEMVVEIMEDYVTPVEESAVLSVYRTLGGGLLGDLMTDFKINDVKTGLDEEIGAIASLGGNIMKLTKSKLEEYGKAEAAVFVAIADSFEDSVLLPTIVGEVIYGATDAWLEDEAFLGAAKPDLGEMDAMIGPFMDSLLNVLHGDAKNTAALQADIRTLAEMVSILADKGVFASMSDTNQMLTALSADGVVDGIVLKLGANQTMKVLIPEFTNLGIRAVATTLGIPADTEAVYNQFMSEVATAVNDTKNLPDNERIGALAAKLDKAFDTAGISVDGQIIDCYAASMSADLHAVDTAEGIKAADVEAFFAVYAWTLENSEAGDGQQGSTSGMAAAGRLPAREALSLEGTIYEFLTEEQLSKSGASALAVFTSTVSNIPADTPDFAQVATSVVTEVYSELFAENEEVMAHLATVEITKEVSKKTVESTTALQSAETVITVKVTMNDLLIATDSVGELLTEEAVQKEAEAVAAIMSVATNLLGSLGNEEGEQMDLGTIAESVGGVLDALQKTDTFGADKTSTLFTAVIQSETVRGTADLDMETATELAKKASEGDVNYSATMNTVTSAINVMTSIGANGEELSQEELVKLIENIQPQTAAALEVYMTADRMISYGIPAEYAATVTELISSTFSYMARNDLPNYQAEADALNHVLAVAMSAQSNGSGDQPLFGGVLPSATETIEIFMASHAISYSIRTTIMNEDGTVKEGKYDVFGLGASTPENSPEYVELKAAIDAYYAKPENHTEEVRLTLVAVGAFFGIEVTFAS